MKDGSRAQLIYDKEFAETLEGIRAHFNFASPAEVVKIAVALLDLQRRSEIQGNQIAVVNSKGEIVNTISFGEGHKRPLLAHESAATQDEESNATNEKQNRKRHDVFRL